MSRGVQELRNVGITVSDLARLSVFYRDALGFTVGREIMLDDEAKRLYGLDDAAAWCVHLHLGRQTLKLLSTQAAQRPYPQLRKATDAWFQHIAIVVPDMDAAHTHLLGFGIEAITQDGPQTLPASSGGVRAFKFRDPDGHPLELLEFPKGARDPQWAHAAKDALFLGYDHSAIVVADTKRSLAFYEGALGLSVASRSDNRGAEQERLDHTADVRVTVLGLQPAGHGTPHVELLAYVNPTVVPLHGPLPLTDIAATHLTLSVTNWDEMMRRLRAYATTQRIGFAGHDETGRRAIFVHDPDRHAVLLTESEPHEV